MWRRSMKTNLLLVTFVVLIGQGCVSPGMGAGYGSQYEPVVDQPLDDAYYLDLAKCRKLAREVQARKQNEALGHALAGAILGAAIGAAAGQDRGDVAGGAALGGALGIGSGSVNAVSAGKQIVLNCMIRRGHNVLY